jgi:hypothetical protein
MATSYKYCKGGAEFCVLCVKFVVQNVNVFVAK